MEDGHLRLEELRVGHRLVLALAGEVDLASVAVVQAAVDRLRSCGAAEVWIDLSRVGFIDSTGLSALISARRALVPERSLMLICPDGPALRNVEAASHAARQLYPDGRALHPETLPRSPVIGTDAPVQYEQRDDIGLPRKRLPARS